MLQGIFGIGDLFFAERQFLLKCSYLILLTDELDVLFIVSCRSQAELIGQLAETAIRLRDFFFYAIQFQVALVELRVDSTYRLGQFLNAFFDQFPAIGHFLNQGFKVGQTGGQRHFFLRQLVQHAALLLHFEVGAFGFEGIHPFFEVEGGSRQAVFFTFCFLDGLFQYFEVLLATDFFALKQTNRTTRYAETALDDAPAARKHHYVLFWQGPLNVFFFSEQYIFEQVTYQVAVSRVGLHQFDGHLRFREESHRYLIIFESIQHKEIGLALLGFAQQFNGVVCFFQVVDHEVVQVGLQKIFDGYTVLLPYINQVRKQRRAFVPVFAFDQILDGFREAFQVFHHAFGKFEFVAFGVQIAAYAGYLLGNLTQFHFAFLEVELALFFGLFEAGYGFLLGLLLFFQFLHLVAQTRYRFLALADFGIVAVDVLVVVVDLVEVDRFLLFQLVDGAFQALLFLDYHIEVGFHRTMAAAGFIELDFSAFQFLLQAGFHPFFYVQLRTVMLDVFFKLHNAALCLLNVLLLFLAILLHKLEFLLQHAAVVFHSPNAAYEAIEVALAIGKGFFFVKMGEAFFFQGSFQVAAFDVNLAKLVLLLFNFALQGFVFALQGSHFDQSQGDAEFFVFGFEFEVFLGALGLFFQRFEVAFNFGKEVFNPIQVFAGAFEFAEGFFFAQLVFGYARGLLKHLAARVFLVFQNVVHHAQCNNGI